MMCDRIRWRRVLAADLGLFSVALFAFALLPPQTIIFPEWVAMILSTLCLVGVVTHSMRGFRLPGEEYAYLLTGAVGLYVLLVYAHVQGVPLSVKLPFLLFLLSGSVSGYAAHVIDGGREHG